MDSSIPPPPQSATLRKLRPWYLVVAMVLTCAVGITGVLDGYGTMSFLRVGSIPESVVPAEAASAPDDANAPNEAQKTAMQLIGVHELARLRATSDLRRFTFPLSVARLLISIMLVIASALALSGRKGARAFALQALGATVALTVVDYVLTRGVRAASIDAAVQFAAGLPADAPLHELADARWWWFLVRCGVALRIGALALAALALTRARTKSFFRAVARATERAEEP